ncbi:MAG: alpha/beta fold hydrolase [SAR324 cluster bacterium]|nr:alpha/beta fold hydrolase [SAR324 cluster bacterium]
MLRSGKRRNFKLDWSRGLPAIFCLLIFMGCQQKTNQVPDIESRLNPNRSRDYVVLLHGMWRSSHAMDPLENYLEDKDYQVINLSYPSTEFPIETLVERYLHPAVALLQTGPLQKIHFVSHSMGGILVRYYLKHYDVPALGRVVMLSPPNQGTPLADLARGTDWYHDITGPSGKQLGTEEQSLVKTLGPVDFELGVIAGTGSNWTTSWLIPGLDDGVVSVENTKVQGMQDFIAVAEKHYRLRREAQVLQQVAFFLENGRFLHRSA